MMLADILKINIKIRSQSFDFKNDIGTLNFVDIIVNVQKLVVCIINDYFNFFTTSSFVGIKVKPKNLSFF